MTGKDIERVIELGRVIHVKKYLKDEWKRKYEIFKPGKIGSDFKQAVCKAWGNIKPDLKQVAWYDKINEITPPNSPYYLSDSLYYGVIDLFYNNYTACRYIDNKNLYDLLFHDIDCPMTILRKVNGVLMDNKYKPIDLDGAYSLVSGLENGVIVKPSVLSVGGHGIKVLKKGASKEDLADVLAKQPHCVVQELIRQHENMAGLHRESVNTVRIITWVRANGKIEILNSIVRMGVAGSFVDNASSGGIFCGVKEGGWLADVAYNTSGKRFEKHPQGAEFGKVQVPNYDQCVALVLELAPRMLSTSRLVSWDIAISEAGKPMLIEANLAYGELDFHQITKGPLFGEYTPEMIEEVFSHKRNVYLSKFV